MYVNFIRFVGRTFLNVTDVESRLTLEKINSILVRIFEKFTSVPILCVKYGTLSALSS